MLTFAFFWLPLTSHSQISIQLLQTALCLPWVFFSPWLIVLHILLPDQPVSSPPDALQFPNIPFQMQCPKQKPEVHMGSDQSRIQSMFFLCSRLWKTTASQHENRSEKGGDVEKHNQGHHRVSLENHTKKNSISKQFFSSFPELRWKTVSSLDWSKCKSQTRQK